MTASTLPELLAWIDERIADLEEEAFERDRDVSGPPSYQAFQYRLQWDAREEIDHLAAIREHLAKVEEA